MQDNVSVLIATILAVIIIVLFPIYNIATRQDSVSKNMVVKATTNFVDDVRNKGYIEAEDYYKFLDEINRTGNSYEVELEVYKPVFIDIDESGTYEEKYAVEYTNSIMSKFTASTLSVAEVAGEESETGEIEVSEDITNTVLDQNTYYLNEGYKFYVRVKNTNITQAQILLDRLFGGKITERIVVNYGGIVYTNEWTKGEDAVTSNANISISRPMDKEGNEYKYEVIADVYDPYTDEYNTIYGIAVRLSEVTANEEINFILTYEEIEEIAGEKSDRIAHIKSYFEPVGFTADEDVAEVEVPVQNSDGTWNYTYLIKLTNIQYDFDNNPYLNATVKVRSGSADTKAGMLGTLNSEEFVLFYDMAVPEVELSCTPGIEQVLNEDGVIENVVDTGCSSKGKLLDSVEIEFKAKGFLESVTNQIKSIVYYVKNIDTGGNIIHEETVTYDVDENNEAQYLHTFKKGKGTVTVYAIDTEGHRSEEVTLDFKVDVIVWETSGTLTRANRSKEYDDKSNSYTEWHGISISDARMIKFTYTLNVGLEHIKDMEDNENDILRLKQRTASEDNYDIRIDKIREKGIYKTTFTGSKNLNTIHLDVSYEFEERCIDWDNGFNSRLDYDCVEWEKYDSYHWDDFKIDYIIKYVKIR